MSTAQEAARSGATFAAIPFVALLGLHREQAGDGRALVRADDDPAHHDDTGTLGPAVLLAMVDTAMASAAIASVDFSHSAATLDLDARFIARRPGPLWARARVVAGDGRLRICEADVHDAAGTLVARAQGSFRLLPHAPES